MSILVLVSFLLTLMQVQADTDVVRGRKRNYDMFLDYSSAGAAPATTSKDDFARIKRVRKHHQFCLRLSWQVKSRTTSPVAGQEAPGVSVTGIIIKPTCPTSHPPESCVAERSASVCYQARAMIQPSVTPQVNVLPPVPALSRFLSTIVGYCRIGKPELSDLLDSGKRFLNRKRNTGKSYGREDCYVTIVKAGIERTFTVRRSRRVAGLIKAS